MFKFTVTLVRPDYMADNYGTDVYITHVEVVTNDPKQAVHEAKNEVWTIDNSGPDGLHEHTVGNPEDYHCIAAYEGHLNPVYGD